MDENFLNFCKTYIFALNKKKTHETKLNRRSGKIHLNRELSCYTSISIIKK